MRLKISDKDKFLNDGEIYFSYIDFRPCEYEYGTINF